MNVEYCSLPLLMKIGLDFFFSEIRIAIATCFLVSFVWNTFYLVSIISCEVCLLETAKVESLYWGVEVIDI